MGEKEKKRNKKKKKSRDSKICLSFHFEFKYHNFVTGISHFVKLYLYSVTLKIFFHLFYTSSLFLEVRALPKNKHPCQGELS